MAAAKRGSPLDRRRACGDFVDMDPLALDPYSFQMSPPPPRHDPVPGADFETLCAHFGEDRMAQRGAVAVPIYQASTFMFPDSAAWEQREAPDSPYYEYTRVGNPSPGVLEAKLARLEQGNWALALGSGMGAIAAAINACVHAGAHVVASGTIYWPTRRYLRDYLPRFGVETTFVDSCDPADFDPAEHQAHVPRKPDQWAVRDAGRCADRGRGTRAWSGHGFRQLVGDAVLPDPAGPGL